MTTDEMSSFVECVSRLYDDSGLDLALERDQTIYGSEIDDDLEALGVLVADIDSSKSPHEIIMDPLMSDARDLAASILQAWSSDDDESGALE